MVGENTNHGISISLSLKDGGTAKPETGQRKPDVKGRPVQKSNTPLNPFQAKLAELKKNFKE